MLRYLKGTKQTELCYRKCDDENLRLSAYSDADWAAGLTDRRSMTSYCISVSANRPLIARETKKQSTVALSTCEVVYMVLAATTGECLYLEQLLKGTDGYKYAS